MTSGEKIQPAMTREEWRKRSASLVEPDSPNRGADEWATATPSSVMIECPGCGCQMLPHRPHAVAALALHEQPFGFTQNDLSTIRLLIRAAADPSAYWSTWEDDDWEGATLEGRALRLADRIAALLPPREETE